MTADDLTTGGKPMSSEAQIVEQFALAMHEQNIPVASQDIIADGQFHRIHVQGDGGLSKNGFYVLHIDDRPAGSFGCNKRYGNEHKFTWSAKAFTPLTPEERRAFAIKMEAQRVEREAKKVAARAAAAEVANRVWDAAAPCTDHPYLVRKGVASHGLRVGRWEMADRETGEIRLISDNALLVPLRDVKKRIHSLQAVFPSKLMGDRDKDYLRDGAKKGLFYSFGKPAPGPDGRDVILIGEGYATMASAHECTGHAAIAAFDAGNLVHVGLAIRTRYSGACILFLADNDQWTTTPVDNPGVTNARAAANAVGGLVAIPDFGMDPEGRPTDFNDLHQRVGADAVLAAIDLALIPAPQPRPVADPEPEDEGPAPWDDVCQAEDIDFVDHGDRDAAVIEGDKFELAPVSGGVALQAQDPGATRLYDDLGIVALGLHGDRLVFWREDCRIVLLLRASELGSHQALQKLAPTQRWEIWGLAVGGLKTTLASNCLIDLCTRIGKVELSLVSAVAPEAVRAAFLRAQVTSGASPAPIILAELLALEPEWSKAIHYDMFAGRSACGAPLPCGGLPGPLTDEHDEMIAGYLSKIHGVNVSSKVAHEAANLLAKQNQIHPPRQYFEGLVWDETQRLDTWLIDCAGAVDTPFVRAASAKTLIGSVARIFNPGAKVDTALVLEGEQGLKKSSLLRSLIPDDAWFAEDLAGAIGNKDALQGLQGKMMVELAELAATKKSAVDEVKSFLSRQVDSFRSPYGRRVADHPRQVIFVGTVNPGPDGSWMCDASGGRRFWPVKVTRVDVGLLVEIRDQLWAEAVHRQRAGEPHWLSDSEEALAASEQLGRLQENPWAESVERYIANLASLHDGLATADLFEQSQGRKPTSRDSADLRRIGEVLKALRWSSQLYGCNRLKRWFPPITAF